MAPSEPSWLAMAPGWCHSGAMDLTPYVENLRRELVTAAGAGGEDARALAERITAPLESATRLMLLNALSAAADEITRDLAPGSVDVRLRGLDPAFVVRSPLADEPGGGVEELAGPPPPAAPAAPTAVPPDTDDGGTARINLRLPANVKARVEEAAGRAHLSVNAWLARAVTAALETGDQRRRPGRGGSRGGQHYTGWVR